MKLKGSCHCQAVRFTLESAQPYPFMRCYCSICRKTAGGGGYAINLGGDYRTLTVEGREHLGVYQARLVDAESGEVKVSDCMQLPLPERGAVGWRKSLSLG